MIPRTPASGLTPQAVSGIADVSSASVHNLRMHLENLRLVLHRRRRARMVGKWEVCFFEFQEATADPSASPRDDSIQWGQFGRPERLT
jgi:hypothetical protein